MSITVFLKFFLKFGHALKLKEVHQCYFLGLLWADITHGASTVKSLLPVEGLCSCSVVIISIRVGKEF
jgi:hypothetical protein